MVATVEITWKKNDVTENYWINLSSEKKILPTATFKDIDFQIEVVKISNIQERERWLAFYSSYQINPKFRLPKQN